MSVRPAYAVRSLVAAAALLAGSASLLVSTDALALDATDTTQVAAPDYRTDPDRRPKPKDWVVFPPIWKI